jgi:hypothetical protein
MRNDRCLCWDGDRIHYRQKGLRPSAAVPDFAAAAGAGEQNVTGQAQSMIAFVDVSDDGLLDGFWEGWNAVVSGMRQMDII